jgi:hypothetical protein
MGAKKNNLKRAKGLEDRQNSWKNPAGKKPGSMNPNKTGYGNVPNLKGK